MKKLTTLSILLLIALSGSAQKKKATTTADNRLQGIDEILTSILTMSKASGFSVAVVEKNKIVYAKGFGYSDAEKKTPASAHTLYAIGSCTKAFTSSLIGLLQKEGKLDVDKPVRTYLPELRFFNNYLNDHVTLRDMMSHRTGLPRHDLSWYLFPTTRDSLISRIQYLEPTAELRTKYQYNNFMFMAQGRVAEKLTGKSWEQLVKEQLFSPLEMTQSTLTANNILSNPNLAVPYDLEKDSSLKKLKHYPVDGMGPAGSIYSSVNEMAHWVQAWIHGGKYNGKEILPAGYINEAISSQMVSNPNPPSMARPNLFFGNYGFGWSMSSYKGHYRVEHGGAIDGFSASTSFFPTDSIGIIVLANQNGSPIPALVRNTLADRMLNADRYDWLAEEIKDRAKAKAIADSVKGKIQSERKKAGPSHTLSQFAGQYTHPGYGTLEVFFRNDSLMAATPKYGMWLEHWHYDVFVPYFLTEADKIDTSDRPTQRFQFNTDVNGEIKSLNMYGIEDPSLNIEFKRTQKVKALPADSLQAYTGEYLLAGATIKVYIKNETLYVLVPGQPDYELQFVGNDKFKLKVVEGYFLQFAKAGKPVAQTATFIQPNGSFTATRKN